MNDDFKIEIPNLDVLEAKTIYATVSETSEMVSEFLSVATVMLQLANYCRLQESAYRYRIDGPVDKALPLEKEQNKIYDNLPEWAKW